MWSKQGRLGCRTAQNNRLNELRIHRNRRPKSGLIVELGTRSETAACTAGERPSGADRIRQIRRAYAAVQPIARNLS
jgi:hypothetical protein